MDNSAPGDEKGKLSNIPMAVVKAEVVVRQDGEWYVAELFGHECRSRQATLAVAMVLSAVADDYRHVAKRLRG